MSKWFLVSKEYIIKENLDRRFPNTKFYYAFIIQKYKFLWWTCKIEVRINSIHTECNIEKTKINLQNFIKTKVKEPKIKDKIVLKFDENGEEKLKSFS